MPPLGRYTRALRHRLWKVPVEREVDSELAFHLEMRTRENLALGMNPEDARAEALHRFGDVNDIAATLRQQGRQRDQEGRRAERLGELRQNTRYALRHLVANPGFSLVAVLTLALGIGASTTIFGIVNAVLLRPFPFHEPERLVRVWETNPTTQYFSVSEPNFLDWRARVASFAGLAAFGYRSVSLVGDGEPERIQAVDVTSSFFPVLGVPPLAGRTFVDDESRPGSGARVAVLSHRLWRQRFGGDPRAIGRTVSLDGAMYQVVGVMPARLHALWEADIWLPLSPRPDADRGDKRLAVIGRLASGVTPSQALEQVRVLAAQLAQQYPDANRDWGAHLETLNEAVVGRELRTRVLILLFAVGLLLLMACVNVANLLLARASVRQREMTVRAALGAGRARIVKQLLTESLILALLGAAAGVIFTVVAVPVLRDIGAAAVPRLSEMNVDWRVLAFGVVASLLTGILFGLAPALETSRADLNDLLRSGGRVAGGTRLRGALIVASVAMALVLLLGAGLVGGSFVKLMHVDTGFDHTGVLTAGLTLPDDRYPAPSNVAFYRELERRLAEIPGVRHVGATNIAPFSGGNTAISFSVVGRAPRKGDEFLSASWRSVTPGYFSALGVRLLRGRLIESTDVDGSPNVIVISDSMARRVWPGEDPIGRQIRVGGSDAAWTVVGLVSGIRDQTLEEEARPLMYLSYQQVSSRSMWFLVRAQCAVDGPCEPMSLANAVRREVWAMDATLPVSDVQPLSRLVGAIAAQPRLTLLVFSLFAGAALALAVVGVYGIVAYGVAQRTREIGVRMALGARPSTIVASIVRGGLRLATLGVVVGLAVAFALSRFVAAILYGVKPTDAAIYLGAALLLTAAAALASLLPARRASHLDPVLALRNE